MSESLTFSYIACDLGYNDRKGKPVVGLYPFWIKDSEEKPRLILHSVTPSIVANIYSGNPYPDFDYGDAVETRIKRDIAHNADSASFVMSQTHGKEWHLVLQPRLR